MAKAAALTRQRVLMLAGYAPAWRHLWEQAAGRFADVITLRTSPKPEGDPTELRFLRRSTSGDYELGLLKWQPERVTDPVTAPVMQRRYRKALRVIEARHGPIDVLHAHFYSSARHVLDLPRPVVVSEHTSVFTRQTSPRVVRRSAAVANNVYSRAAVVMPVSHYQQAAMERAGLRGHFRVVPNPVDVGQFPIRDRGPVPDGEQHLLSVGRLAPTKGYDVGLRALALARQADPMLQWWIAGEGPLRGNLEALAGELGLHGAVSFLGQLSPRALRDRYLAAHVFVGCSRSESFGLPLVEALSTGLPAVATEVGIAPECVTSTQGVLVPPDDAGRLAEGILEAVRNLDRYNAAEVAADVRARYSIEAVAERLQEVYALASRAG